MHTDTARLDTPITDKISSEIILCASDDLTVNVQCTWHMEKRVSPLEEKLFPEAPNGEDNLVQ